MVERAAAIDVAKASGKVCTRVPHPSVAGRQVTKVWYVGATTGAVIALAEELTRQSIQRVVVESNSDYWRPFVYLLEAHGLLVCWSTPATSSRCRAGRRPTSWMLCGCASSTSAACCERASSRQSRSENCVTTPGAAGTS